MYTPQKINSQILYVSGAYDNLINIPQSNYYSIQNQLTLRNVKLAEECVDMEIRDRRSWRALHTNKHLYIIASVQQMSHSANNPMFKLDGLRRAVLVFFSGSADLPCAVCVSAPSGGRARAEQNWSEEGIGQVCMAGRKQIDSARSWSWFLRRLRSDLTRSLSKVKSVLGPT